MQPGRLSSDFYLSSLWNFNDYQNDVSGMLYYENKYMTYNVNQKTNEHP